MTTTVSGSALPLSAVARYHSSLPDDVPIGPWRLSAEWIYATNGHMAVFVRDSAVMVQPAPHPKYIAKPTEWLEASIDGAVSGAFIDLVSFAGELPPMEDRPCDDCDGSGRQDDGHACQHCGRWSHPPCENCAGSGSVDPPFVNRFARVCGLPVNLSLLAVCLASVAPSDTVMVGTIPAKGHRVKGVRMLVADGDGWRIVLMPIVESACQADAPVWPSEGAA